MTTLIPILLFYFISIDVSSEAVGLSCLLKFSQSAQYCCPVTMCDELFKAAITIKVNVTILISASALVPDLAFYRKVFQKKKLIGTGRLQCTSTMICMGLTLPA